MSVIVIAILMLLTVFVAFVVLALTMYLLSTDKYSGYVVIAVAVFFFVVAYFSAAAQQ